MRDIQPRGRGGCWAVGGGGGYSMSWHCDATDDVISPDHTQPHMVTTDRRCRVQPRRKGGNIKTDQSNIITKKQELQISRRKISQLIYLLVDFCSWLSWGLHDRSAQFIICGTVCAIRPLVSADTGARGIFANNLRLFAVSVQLRILITPDYPAIVTWLHVTLLHHRRDKWADYP